MAVQFSDATQQRFEETLSHYPTKQAALLPTFWLAQEEFGHLSLEVMEHIAQLLNLSPAYVASVASFYTMLYKKPMGRFHLQVCTNLSCRLRGSDRIVDCVRNTLGIGPGQTTADQVFSLSEVECLGSCGTAPVVQVNDDYHENLTPDRVVRLLDGLTEKA